MKKNKHVSNPIDLLSNVTLQIASRRRSLKIYKVKANNPPLMEKACSKKKARMSTPVELNHVIQVDNEPNKDLGGKLIDNSQRI